MRLVLFFRFDATNILKENLASVVTSISKDHLDWLPKNEQTIEKIVFEKTSSLLNSNIIVAKQNSKETMDCIKNTISHNKSNKVSILMIIFLILLVKIIFFTMKIN